MNATMEVTSYATDCPIGDDLLQRFLIKDVQLVSTDDGLVVRFIHNGELHHVYPRNQHWNSWGELCFSRSMGGGILQRFKVTFELSPMLASVND